MSSNTTFVPLQMEPISIISSSNSYVTETMYIRNTKQGWMPGYENRAFRNDDDDVSEMTSWSSSSSSGSSDDGKYRDRSIPERIALSWKNLTILTKKNTTLKDNVKSLLTCQKTKYKFILKDVQGIVKPGEMVALMGPSGSGKTTLLNALNYSTKSPLKVKGRIMINGCKADPTRMAMVSKYVQQEYLFFGTMTVKEHLVFHAMLRMERHLSKQEKMQRVERILKDFHLEKISDVKIGIPGIIKGISGGEKRRLAFASEILTDPPLFFCDEPTSGLDSFMAKFLINTLKNMANNNKTIICTIHQPSHEIFAEFHKICILSQTKIAYFGSIKDAQDFFKTKLGKVCPSCANPADFYMNVLGVDVADPVKSEMLIKSYCKTFENSRLNKEITAEIEDNKQEYFPKPPHLQLYKSGWFIQMIFLIRRCFFNYFRNYLVVISNFLMVFLTAILGGLIFLQSGSIENNICTFDQRSTEMASFAIFYSITVSVIFSMLNAVMVFPIEIPIYYQEHAASTYRSDTYYLSKLLNELPIYVILPSLHTLILYFMTLLGCDAGHFFFFLFVTVLISNAAYALGHILSILSTDATMAVSLAAPIIAIQMVFSGFFLTRALRTPQFLTYIKYLSIFNYGYDVLMINQWENAGSLKCEYDLPELCLPTGKDVLKEAKIDPSSKASSVILLAILVVTFRVLAYFVLWLKGQRTLNSKTIKKAINNIEFVP